MTVAPEANGIEARLAAVRAEMHAACQRANRDPQSVTLVAVSKTHSAEEVIAAAKAGQIDFGENRIEEAGNKIVAVRAALPDKPLKWHMIGHVQSRKADDVVAVFDMIHSLDTLKLAERYSRLAEQTKKTVTVLLEVNISGEESKSGFEASGWERDSSVRDSLWNAIRRMVELPALQIVGLMTMAPIVEDMQATRPVFAGLRELSQALRSDFPQLGRELSMGMTDDFPIAIEEGATLIRVGRAIFGPRSNQ